MTILILVGDTGNELCVHAKSLDSNSTLLTKNNCLNLSSGTYYTSLGEFDNYRSFVDTLNQADHLIYSPPRHWSDSDYQNQSNMQNWTEWCLFYFASNRRVDGIEFPVPKDTNIILELADQRHSHATQLWIAGGSDSHGVGVKDDQRFGSILGKMMQQDVSFLTRPRASMEWLADQILRSKLKSGDTVVFSTVPLSRFPFLNEHRLMSVTVNTYQQQPNFQNIIGINNLDNDHTMLYRSISSVAKVCNICQLLDITLVLAGLDQKSQTTAYYASLPNYIHLHGRFGLNLEDRYLDYGDDGAHPGPIMHCWYAENIFQKIQSLKNR